MCNFIYTDICENQYFFTIFTFIKHKIIRKPTNYKKLLFLLNNNDFQ